MCPRRHARQHSFIEVGRFDEGSRGFQPRSQSRAWKPGGHSVDWPAFDHHRRPWIREATSCRSWAQHAAIEEPAAAGAAALQAASSGASSGPSLYESAAVHEPTSHEVAGDPPKHDPPQGDPPGTFDLAQFATPLVSPGPAAVEERRPDLEPPSVSSADRGARNRSGALSGTRSSPGAAPRRSCCSGIDACHHYPLNVRYLTGLRASVGVVVVTPDARQLLVDLSTSRRLRTW